MIKAKIPQSQLLVYLLSFFVHWKLWSLVLIICLFCFVTLWCVQNSTMVGLGLICCTWREMPLLYAHYCFLRAVNEKWIPYMAICGWILITDTIYWSLITLNTELNNHFSGRQKNVQEIWELIYNLFYVFSSKTCFARV